MYLKPHHRVAILLHGGIRGHHGKTGLSFLRYGKAAVVAVIDSESAGESLLHCTKIPLETPIVASLTEALRYNPDVLLIGIAPSGGVLPPDYRDEVTQAVAAGLSVANGLHTLLQPQYPQLQPGQWIWDIRQEPPALEIATAKARRLSCQRWLTVGTDMSIGKMSTSIELNRAAQERGINSQFLATGQAGVMIAGEGICLDAVRVDFAAGAVEKMVMEAGAKCDLVIVEGQGSLLHPGSTATLPLIRGTQATALILVHRAGQKSIFKVPDIVLPPLPEIVKLYETVASAGGAFAQVKVKAIALNTFHLDAAAAIKAITKVQEETGLPCSDVVRFGGASLLNLMMNESV